MKYPLCFIDSYVQSIIQQYESWNHLCIQSSNCRMKTMIPIPRNKPSHLTAKSTLFTVIKNEWDTKEDSDKSMKNRTYCGIPKGTSWAEAMSTRENQ